MRRNFTVLDIVDQCEEWKLPDCINVFFVGVDASKLDMVNFDSTRKIKLRLREEEDPDFEEGMKDFDLDDGLKGLIKLPSNQFTKTPEDRTDDMTVLNNYPDCLNYKHKGFMVVKVEHKQIDIKNEKTGALEEVNRKYIRSYYPYWKETNFENDKRLMYETEIDLKTENPNLDIGSRANVNPEIAEKLIEHEIIAVSGCMNVILCIIVKGILGEQHRQITFNQNQKKCLFQNLR